MHLLKRLINHKLSLFLVLVIVVLNLNACGFKLRGSQALPDTLTQVAINAPLQYSPLSRALQQRLPVYQLSGVINPTESVDKATFEQTVIVQLQPEQFERRLLSIFETGQVAEYELVYTVNYTVVFPNKMPVVNSFTVNREYQDDPNQVLAKSRELDLVLNDLRAESADRLIRLLSSQYNGSVIAPQIQAKAKDTQAMVTNK